MCELHCALEVWKDWVVDQIRSDRVGFTRSTTSHATRTVSLSRY